MDRKIAAAVLGTVLGLALFFLNHFIDVRLWSRAQAQTRRTPAARPQSVPQVPESVSQTPAPFVQSEAPPPRPPTFEEKAYCRLKRAGTRVPLEGRLKISARAYDIDEHGETGVSVLVQSSVCPEGLFSKVRLDASGAIKEERDCRAATKEELFTNSGIQGEVVDNPSTREKLNLAVSGPGYFVYECTDGVYLTRSGDFYTDGPFVTSGPGCRVLNREGRYFEWDGSRLDPNGCNTGGDCIALVEPDPAAIEYVDRIVYRTHGDPLKKPIANGFIFFNALETLDDPQNGPTGPYWPALPEFHVPSDCP